MEEHLASLGLAEARDAVRIEKESVRRSHATQRTELLVAARSRFHASWVDLMRWFVSGSEVDPAAITPSLVPVDARGETGEVFSLASLLWSIPVSRGYGRRMRYLVIDEQNGGLIGILGLGDPVFNLRVRDDAIGWTVAQREQRLVSLLDAFVVGAVPPYSALLGGKLVASLIGSKEVSDAFDRRYGRSVGIISGQAKQARLALVSVTSALGRSSLYNRLHLPGLVDFTRVGVTEGWGHFHVPDRVFADMRQLLTLEGHPYASGHQYGTGPNWRIRVIRAGLIRVGLDPGLLRHGIGREVYVVPLASNWRAYLRCEDNAAAIDRPPASAITAAAKARWIEPRAQRDPRFREWRRSDTIATFRDLLAPDRGKDPAQPLDALTHE